jgi:transcriptional regulator with XRE-family HTH domain
MAIKTHMYRGMSPEQCRAARGWLEWTQQELAHRAGVGLSTVRDFEKGERTPIPNNLAAIGRAFETRGIEFIDEKGKAVGIRLSQNTHGDHISAAEGGANAKR